MAKGKKSMPPVPGGTAKGGLGTKGKKSKAAGNNGNMITGFMKGKGCKKGMC